MIDLEIKLVNKYEINQIKSDSYLPKELFAPMKAVPKLWENAFCFILKAIFVLKIFKLLSLYFVPVKKTA